MYKLKFTKLPKEIKKYLKVNEKRKKSYLLAEANLLFNHVVSETDATGDVAVTIICPTGEPEYEFSVIIDQEQSLSELVLQDFDDFLTQKQIELEELCLDSNKNKEKIQILEDEILILTNRSKEISKEFVGGVVIEAEEVSEQLEKSGVMDAIIEDYKADIVDESDLFDDIEDLAESNSPYDVFFHREKIEEDELEFQEESNQSLNHEPNSKLSKPNEPRDKTEDKSDEDKILTYLDVTTLDAVGVLENKIKEINSQINNGVDHYIFDELYLTSATDFASNEKKEIIRSKYLTQANQTFISMRDWAMTSLDELKRFASNHMKAKHEELNALKVATRKQRVMEMAEILKVSFDRKKGELRKEIIAKCDAEIIKMEATLDAEKEEKLAIETVKIDQALSKGIEINHEKALVECRAEVAGITEEKVNVVFETINKGYSGLLNEIKANLTEHEKTIETRYQLYKDDKNDQFAKDLSNRELQLRTRQLEIEEKRLRHTNETKELSGQVEQLKMMIEKNRLEDQMKLLSRDKEEQAKEMTKFKRLIGASFVLMTLAMAGIVAFSLMG